MQLILIFVIIIAVTATAVVFFIQKRTSTEGICARAEKLMMQDEFTQAETLLLDLLKKDPDNPQAHVLVGRIRLQAGKNKEALEAFQKALEAKPDDPAALVGEGMVYVRDNEIKKAFAVHKKLKAIDEKHAAVLLGEIHTLVPPADVQKEQEKELKKAERAAMATPDEAPAKSKDSK